MKKIKILLAVIVTITLFSCEGDEDGNIECCILPPKPSALNVCSFNIRFSNDTPDTGNRNWTVRKNWIVDFVNNYEIDVIGMQEEKDDQTADLKVLLAEKYKTVGKASSGEPGYEYNGVYYKTSTIALLDSGRFWLSETPDVESIGWDAIYQRQVTWCHFKEIGSGKEFFFFNTHFSHIKGPAQITDNSVARANSTKLLRNKVKSISRGEAVIVTGDFNIWPTSDTYQALTGSELAGTQLIDSRTLVSTPLGPNYSGHCFGECIVDGKIVDYVFVNDKVSATKHEIVDEQPSPTSYLSDHYPVFAEISID